MNTEILSTIDFIKNVLPFELRSRAKGRPIQVISDFDETQCSNYVFSNRWNTHVPKIRTDLAKEAKLLTRPMCLATARTPNEPVSWVIWHKLSKPPMPLVAENGAVLVWPSTKVNKTPETEILATNKQIETIKDIQRKLEMDMIKELEVPLGHEVVLRSGRLATVEIRAQEKDSRRGTPEDYTSLKEQLQVIFPNALSQIDIVTSGSSLGIQPKGVSKETGIQAALVQSKMGIKDVFLVGMGDNKNDVPLFDFVKKNGGLTIGVRPITKSLCDLTLDGGDEVSLQVLRAVNALKGTST